VIWIVGGPSSAGKSTFIDSPRSAQVTGLPRGTPVYFPKDVGPGTPPPGQDCFIHYNFLRPFYRVERPAEVPVDARLFADEPFWRRIVALPGEKRVVVVVADRATLLGRVKGRAQVEAGDGHEYDGRRWVRIYEAIDVAAVYRVWREELVRLGLPFVEVDGGGGA
jgi:hypothetical protein